MVWWALPTTDLHVPSLLYVQTLRSMSQCFDGKKTAHTVRERVCVQYLWLVFTDVMYSSIALAGMCTLQFRNSTYFSLSLSHSLTFLSTSTSSLISSSSSCINTYTTHIECIGNQWRVWSTHLGHLHYLDSSQLASLDMPALVYLTVRTVSHNLNQFKYPSRVLVAAREKEREAILRRGFTC